MIIAVGIEPDAAGPPGSTTPQSFSLNVSVGVPPYTESTITGACNDMTGADPLAGVAGDDSTSATVALPFAFNFFRAAVTHYSVNSNGLMQLWDSAMGTGATTFLNTEAPSESNPTGFVAPFWDDLIPGTVVTATSGTMPNRVFTVQWASFGFFNDRSAALTFQAQLYETSNNIEFHYCTMTAGMTAAFATGSSATVGLENEAETLGAQHSFNTADSVDMADGIRFTAN